MMDNICAKLKQREKNKYRTLTAVDDALYSISAISADLAVAYAPDTLLGEGEWFFIERVSETDYFINALSSIGSAVDFQTLDRQDFSKIDFIFVLSEKYIAFQNISKTKLLSKRRLLALGEAYEYKNNCNEIIINDIPDAFYDKTHDILYFKRLESITGIFVGIDQLYRAATEEETNRFLNSDFINLIGGYSSENVKTPNRKRIALAMKTLEALKDEDRKNIFAYIGEYCPELRVSASSFNIGTEDDMKKLLFGIQQRFYTTPVGGEKRIANSIIPLVG